MEKLLLVDFKKLESIVDSNLELVDNSDSLYRNLNYLYRGATRYVGGFVFSKELEKTKKLLEELDGSSYCVEQLDTIKLALCEENIHKDGYNNIHAASMLAGEIHSFFVSEKNKKTEELSKSYDLLVEFLIKNSTKFLTSFEKRKEAKIHVDNLHEEVDCGHGCPCPNGPDSDEECENTKENYSSATDEWFILFDDFVESSKL